MTQSSPEHCLDCEPGYYCPGEKNVDYKTHQCDPGYYCKAGSDRKDQHKCPAGSMCEAGEQS